MTYSEDVHTPQPLTFALITLITVGTGGLGIWMLVGEDQLVGAVVILAGGLTAAVLSVFLVLRIRADGEVLRARFGPWGLSIAAEQIESASVARYPWLSYGGWGMRWGRHEGRPGRALSIPLMRTGVFVDTTEGKRHYLNSRQPEELAEAVNRLRGVSSGG